MKRTNIILFAFALILFLGMGCEEVGNCERGRGPIVSKQLELPSFHSLKLSGSDKVIVTQGPQQEVWVEGEENIIDLIRLSVSNGEWDIRTRGCVGRHERLIYHVTLPEIKGLSLSGSGDIVGENTFLTSRIELEVTGSGSITADVDADDVEAEITGSGLLILSGSSQQVDVEITGSGEAEFLELQAEAVQVDIEGSGDAYVTALRRLDVEIRGSGDVYYRGNPVINSSITGSGRLIKR